MKKQTAVEWLMEQMSLGDRMHLAENGVDFEKAKAMEKEQTIVAYSCGARDAILNLDFVDAFEYYRETYGGDK
jgi:hypothetical protein